MEIMKGIIMQDNPLNNTQIISKNNDNLAQLFPQVKSDQYGRGLHDSEDRTHSIQVTQRIEGLSYIERSNDRVESVISAEDRQDYKEQVLIEDNY